MNDKRDMYFMEKIAVWIFIHRTKQNLFKLYRLESGDLDLYQLKLLHKAYSHVFDGILDIRKWGANLNPTFKWVTLEWFVKIKILKIEETVNANKT